MSPKKTSSKTPKKTTSRKTEKSGEEPPFRLVVIDGANSIYRAFFAIPGLRAPDGTPTNAVLGFATMLLKVLREEKPTHLVVASDPQGGSFRRDIFPEYKAGRDAQPEELTAQLPLIAELCEAFRVPMVVVPNFEADDVIATLVEHAPEGGEVGIVSTDKDLMQLVRPGVLLLDTMKGKRVDEAAVEERFGVPPSMLLDVRSLVGDPSDNIPGVKGIGEKGAAKLILEWGTLEALLEGASQVKAKRAREGLIEQADEARLSKELSTLRSDVPFDLDWEAFAVSAPEKETLRELYQRFGFTRLLDHLDRDLGEGEESKAAGASRGKGAAKGSPTSSSSHAAEAAEIVVLETKVALDQCIDQLLEAAGSDSAIALHPVIEGTGPYESRLFGLALSAATGPVGYVVLGGDGLFDRQGVQPEELADALTQLFGRLETTPSGDVAHWVGFDTKSLRNLLMRMGAPPPIPLLDIGLVGQLVETGGSHDLSALAQGYLGRGVPSWEEVAGRGAKAKSAEDLGIEIVSRWAAEQARVLVALVDPLRKRLASEELSELYEEIERPLCPVLSRMELAGVRIDEPHLHRLSEEYEKTLDQIEKKIHELAGEEFLVSSPKQLQVILFEKLGLPILKKTKTGYSTAEGVLEQLVVHHPLPGEVLAWRKLSKLKSTYIDALPPLVSSETGRIHPQFHQLGAATGRLSASNPNVQNIPIRGDQGARIREAFIPAEGRILLAADYSQVELRIMAHFSGDESLIEAFRAGEDIHRRTAAEVAGIALEDVTDDLRARAKAINFGILYGSTSFGIAQQLGIAAGEAQETIDAYFARYAGVRRFLDETMEEAKKDGFVRTLLGRRRYLPDLASRNRVLRQAAERMATNTVIQGTAADLIKKAMVGVDSALRASKLEATLILQVHDELVFETSEACREELTALVTELMEGVAELSVPLTVDVGIGQNWRAAH